MSTRRCSHVPSRLGLVSLLQVPLLYWIYQGQFGARFIGHSYLPSEPDLFLAQASIATVSLVLVFPILLRGDLVQKFLAGVLVPLPLLILGVAVYWIVWIFRWTYA
jgi:hypothetical protein